ncbi:MAG: threonine-phosphate decarboxylase CobD [Clostridium sp.]
MAVHGGNVEEIGRKYNLNPKDILDFSANINPLGLNEKVKDSMISALDLVERYPDITYYNLKHTICSHEGIDLSKIFIGNGAAEVIFNIARALKPKKVLLPAPTFSEYEEAVRSIDGEIKYYSLKEENEFRIDDNFINHIDEEIDLVFICNPNNPTGVLTEKEFVEKVLKKAKEFGTKVVLDESFLDFVEDKFKYSSMELIKNYNNLIIVKSLTKFFAMPGIRIGYGITSNEAIIESINKVSVPWAVNIVAAEGVCTGVKEKEYINRSIKYVEKQKNWLYEELNKLEFIKVFKPSVNFIMFKSLKNINLKEELILKGVIIRGCGNYEGLSENFYRVAVRTVEENEKLISTMKTVSFDK